MDRNYEQEYKKAFEAAKGLHEAGNALTKKQMEIVFPQLAESEDERIRKELVAFFIEVRNREGNEGYWHDLKVADILAYIEKQKEQKKSLSERFRPDFPAVADFIESVDELEKNMAIEIPSEKQKEQKPAEINFKALLTADRLASAEMTGRLKERSEILENPEKYGLQKPAEWSEDDEKMAYFVNQFLEYHELSDPTAKSCKKWFENRFKSLRPVSKESLQSWKPTEDQMKALQWWSELPSCSPGLKSLYKDLKKLI